MLARVGRARARLMQHSKGRRRVSGPQRYAAGAAAVTTAAAAQCRDGTENGGVVLSPVTREHQARADGRRRTDAGAFKRKGAEAKSAKAASSDDGVEDGERGAQGRGGDSDAANGRERR